MRGPPGYDPSPIPPGLAPAPSCRKNYLRMDNFTNTSNALNGTGSSTSLCYNSTAPESSLYSIPVTCSRSNSKTPSSTSSRSATSSSSAISHTFPSSTFIPTSYTAPPSPSSSSKDQNTHSDPSDHNSHDSHHHSTPVTQQLAFIIPITIIAVLALVALVVLIWRCKMRPKRSPLAVVYIPGQHY